MSGKFEPSLAKLLVCLAPTERRVAGYDVGQLVAVLQVCVNGVFGVALLDSGSLLLPAQRDGCVVVVINT